MPSASPIATTRLDSTCFSDFDNLSDFDSDTDDTDCDSHYHLFNLVHPTAMGKKQRRNRQAQAETENRASLSDLVMDTSARYTHPTFPPSSFLTTYQQPERFETYIKNEFPPVAFTIPSESPSFEASTTTSEKELIRKEVNATVANSLLTGKIHINIATSSWILDEVFPNSQLPKPFNRKCLDDVEECWDMRRQRFSNFPEATLEKTVQDWLNHLTHVLGVKHGLIEPADEQPPSHAPSPAPEALSYVSERSSPASHEELLPASEELPPAPDKLMSISEGLPPVPEKPMSIYEGEDEVDNGSNHSAEMGGNENAEATLDEGVKETGYVAPNAEDRSFSMTGHNLAPTGGYRPRKPDIILLNRTLRHYLHEKNYRPRWQHIQAIVEVSSSASHKDMIRQILEKAALMFEAQPFRRFAIGLAFRGVAANGIEYCFLLIDRSGACITRWSFCTSYSGIDLAHIIYALSYAKPELLGVDTSMTVDPISGNVTKIKVEDKEFEVVKHINASLILFGRGTHIFLVRDKEQRLHILKDAWILVDHGISEIDVLSHIKTTLEQDSSKEAQEYQALHSRYIAGEDIGDSTKARRGKLLNLPAERRHRRVVTGPVGDPLTSFRSREEFVKVLLDCVKWLEYLHNKCGLVHADLSVNNIVIFRAPLERPPSIASMSKNGTTKSTNPNMATRVTRSVGQQARAPFVPAPRTGVDEDIPVVGVVIDYDCARRKDTFMDQILGTPPYMPMAALDVANRGKYVHSDDLESLLHTAIAITCFTNGPCGELRPAIDHVPTSRWFNEVDPEQLFKDKIIDLICYDKEIDQHITPYWRPFAPYLRRLAMATWDLNLQNLKSEAKHETFKEILEEALHAFKMQAEIPAKYASIRVPQKRSRSIAKADESRFPYSIKYSRGDGPDGRYSRPINIKQISVWKDSVDA